MLKIFFKKKILFLIHSILFPSHSNFISFHFLTQKKLVNILLVHRNFHLFIPSKCCIIYNTKMVYYLILIYCAKNIWSVHMPRGRWQELIRWNILAISHYLLILWRPPRFDFSCFLSLTWWLGCIKINVSQIGVVGLVGCFHI